MAGLIAVAVLTWMLFWMRRQGRAMKGELERGVDAALHAGGTMALVGLAFVAVIREGLETTLFVLALIPRRSGRARRGARRVAGLAVAVGVGWAIFVGGRRVDLRKFFTITGVVLIFVAAGLVAFSIAEFGEAGLIANAGSAFDLNGVFPDSSPAGNVLRGLFGYRSEPTPLEVIGYFAYLIPVLTVYIVTDRTRPATRRAAA